MEYCKGEWLIEHLCRYQFIQMDKHFSFRLIRVWLRNNLNFKDKFYISLFDYSLYKSTFICFYPIFLARLTVFRFKIYSQPIVWRKIIRIFFQINEIYFKTNRDTLQLCCDQKSYLLVRRTMRFQIFFHLIIYRNFWLITRNLQHIITTKRQNELSYLPISLIEKIKFNKFCITLKASNDTRTKQHSEFES